MEVGKQTVTESKNLSIIEPSKSAQKCRICLEPGLIPIFGSFEVPDISIAVKTFGDITIYYSDNFPKHLCGSCHELLQGAIIFRNNAKKSDIILRSFEIETTKSLNDENVSLDDENESLNYENESLHYENISFNYENESLNDESESLNNERYNVHEAQFEDSNLTEKRDDESGGNDNEMIMIIVSDENKELKEANDNLSDIESTYNHEDMTYKNMRYRLRKVKSNKLLRNHQETHCNVDFETESNNCSISNPNSADEKELLDCFTSTDDTVTRTKKCKVNYNNHIKTHNVTAPKKRYCPICEKNVTYTYFKNHMSRVHNTEIQNIMEEVDGNINTKKTKTLKQYVCDKCGKVFKRPTTFKLHTLTHTSELKYKCMFCPYKGLHQALLKIHVRTHTGDYNYKCTKCPAKFITKSNMNKHMKRHRGPVDFKCDKCKRGFYSKLELERHDKVDHLGIKNHICNICGLAFGYRNGMMNHQLKVHKREKLTKGKGRRPNYLVAETNKEA